ncbi:UPF0481 protein At3g47200-like [Chenopodium quinoa]|uniref:UPF0481 protein At3g47200-like n=1 Tax=Chenopodium quinoa TaxID=63459 RepID=UPI000B7790F7|nr:UPF0481 protein At3g47200-like [Chenopodium quinoa]
MSIGPIYYKDKNLETMQEVKWIYLNYFLNNPNNACPSLEHYINFVSEKEGEIRGSYQQQIRIPNHEFIEMVVLDAVFLVYHFMCRSGMFPNPCIEKKLQGLMPYLSKDLFLLENQLPFFVVKGIFYKAFGDVYGANTIIIVTLANICMTRIPGVKAIKSILDGKKIVSESNIKHLLDLQRMSCCLSLSTPLRNESKIDQTVNSKLYIVYIHKAMSSCIRSSLLLLCNNRLCQRYVKKTREVVDGRNCHLAYTAKQLKDAGVIFVAGESENPLDITFRKGKLEIAKLEINDHTEAYFRSMIYYEQCHYSEDSYFIDYIFFLDELIDTVEDVQVLVKNKIFSNYLGSDEDVIKLFNNIGKHLNLSCDYYYSGVCSAVNGYASTRWHRWMAILRRNYLNHPWVILSVIAAFILFVLTLLQTIASYTD